MAMLKASARPRKVFFVEMFTRDVSLINCILDLIDNSVDGLIRSQGINLGEDLLLRPPEGTNKASFPTVRVKWDDRTFHIEDDCGGIGLKLAKTVIFNFGYGIEQHKKQDRYQLGVYGIGLKRALFKIGKEFSVESHTMTDGFKLDVDVDEWVAQDKTLKDWYFDLEPRQAATKSGAVGTSITVKRFRQEVATAFQDPTFAGRLEKAVSQVYSLFVGKYVRILLNDKEVQPIAIPFGVSDEVTPAKEVIKEGKVEIYLMASIAARDKSREWKQETAGWYVGCNGRLVVTADKSELTGWGTGALPTFVSKYRGFVGLALFQSPEPLLLPWRTTKYGLNEESDIYQRARTQMNALARPILRFLDKMYPKEPSESSEEREIASGAGPISVRDLSNGQKATFDVKSRTRRTDKSTVSIQFSAEKGHIESIKRHIRRPDFTGGQVGKYTFEWFLKHEVEK